MRRWVVLLSLPLALLAEERWLELRQGPFEVLTNAGDRSGREVLAELDQLRWLLGAALGKPDLKTTWPLRVLVFKSPQQLAPFAAASTLALARDAYVAALAAGAPYPPEFLREFVRILIESAAGRMPPGIESGLEDFYSTAQVSATKITLGQPPPAARRNLDWARIHLLVTSPEYSGRLRILLFNLQAGSDPEPSFRNAFGKSAAEIDQQAAAWLAAGNFPTVIVSGKPLNPNRDYTPQIAEPPLAAARLADLRLRAGADPAPAYRALLAASPAVAHEGLGLLALRAGREEEARAELAAATEAGSTSAPAWLEYARLNPDKVKAAAALQKAAELNPNWSEPYVLLAGIEADPSRALNWLKTAASLEPRNAARWRAVAEVYQRHNLYPQAAKAWAAAEAASVDEGERQRIREARSGIEEQRLAFADAERKRREEERERSLQRLKDAALAEIHAAEERANRANPRANPGGTVVPWSSGDAPSGKVRGQLTRVECAGRMVRVVIRTAEGNQTRLAVRDPHSVLVFGRGFSFPCGPQAPAPAVTAEYYAKPDAKLGTAGDLATLEFE